MHYICKLVLHSQTAFFVVAEKRVWLPYLRSFVAVKGQEKNDAVKGQALILVKVKGHVLF